MSDQDEAVTPEPLDVVARKIAVHPNKADEHVIAAAMLVRDARHRVEAGEAGDIKWYAWADKNIKLSTSRLRDLQRIAEADDPAKELDRQRRMMRKRVEEHRKRKTAESRALAEERRELIAWAKKAPIEAVRRVLGQVSGRANAALAGSANVGQATERRQAA